MISNEILSGPDLFNIGCCQRTERRRPYNTPIAHFTHHTRLFTEMNLTATAEININRKLHAKHQQFCHGHDHFSNVYFCIDNLTLFAWFYYGKLVVDTHTSELFCSTQKAEKQIEIARIQRVCVCARCMWGRTRIALLTTGIFKDWWT